MRALGPWDTLLGKLGETMSPFFLEEKVGAVCEATGRKLARSSRVDGAS